MDENQKKPFYITTPIDVYKRQLQNIREHLRAIGNGFCVRHTADTGHTACRSCPTSGQDVLLMGKSWVTQMDMDVQKAGSRAQSAGIQQLCTLCNRAVF